MLELLLHVCRIFILTNSSNYAKATLYYTMQLVEYKQKNHPVWNAFKVEVCGFSEEQGEITLGQLFQALLHDNRRQDSDHVRRVYLLLNHASSLYQHYLESNELNLPFNLEVVNQDSVELKGSVSFFMQFIGKNKQNNYRSYTGEMKSWKNWNVAEKSLTVVNHDAIIPVDSVKFKAKQFLIKFDLEITKKDWTKNILEELQMRGIAQAPEVKEEIKESIEEGSIFAEEAEEAADLEEDDTGKPNF